MTLTPAQQKTYEELLKVRESKTVSLKKTPLLNDDIADYFTKELKPFKLRYYQVQGVYHLLSMKRILLGDDLGLGKTIEVLATFCYLWDKNPNLKPIVVVPKSAVQQWANEIERFTTGIRPIVVGEGKKKNQTTLEAREASYHDWATSTDKTVLIINYALLIRDWNVGGLQPPDAKGKLAKQPVKPGLLDGITKDLSTNLICCFDEAQAFMSMSTKTWEIVRFLSDRADRVIAMTATPIKNKLQELYSIYKAIKPDLFGTKTKFLEDFCYFKLQSVARNRKIPVVIGYHDLDKFRKIIDPFYLGRKKQDVSNEMPALTSREIACELSEAEDIKYDEALSGLLTLGDGNVKDFEDNKILVSLIYCQQVVDSLALLKFKEGDQIPTGMAFEDTTTRVGALHSKEQMLVDLLTTELKDHKVIVYTRFESLVGRLQACLTNEGIKSSRITGKEAQKARLASQEAFQDLGSDTVVVFITNAGTAAINLQAAAALVFFDLPWSWGDYSQCLGRMVRMGSPHQNVLAYHLLAQRGGGGKTIDHHVLRLLRSKKGVSDAVFGEAAVGALKFESEAINPRDILREFQKDTKEKNGR